MGNPTITKAQETLEFLSHDPVARAKYEARQKYILDYNTSMYTSRNEGIEVGLEKGKAEGIAEGEMNAKRKIAQNMRNLNLPIDFVCKATGLSAKELEKL